MDLDDWGTLLTVITVLTLLTALYIAAALSKHHKNTLDRRNHTADVYRPNGPGAHPQP